jgi:hypothetical protein
MIEHAGLLELSWLEKENTWTKHLSEVSLEATTNTTYPGLV